MKIMTLHEILLLNHSIVLRFDETIRATPLRHHRSASCSHRRDAERQDDPDRREHDRPQHLSQRVLEQFKGI